MPLPDWNPYAPPQTSAGNRITAASELVSRILSRFRLRCHLLASTLLLLGVAAIPPAIVTFYDGDDDCMMWGPIAASLVVLGASVGFKKMWAIRVILAGCWFFALCLVVLAFALQLFRQVNATLFASLLTSVFALVAIQCHLILRWSRTIRAAGLLLTANPGDNPPDSSERIVAASGDRQG